jgi:hypothetical protein
MQIPDEVFEPLRIVAPIIVAILGWKGWLWFRGGRRKDVAESTDFAAREATYEMLVKDNKRLSELAREMVAQLKIRLMAAEADAATYRETLKSFYGGGSV